MLISTLRLLKHQNTIIIELLYKRRVGLDNRYICEEQWFPRFCNKSIGFSIIINSIVLSGEAFFALLLFVYMVQKSITLCQFKALAIQSFKYY